MKQWRRSQRQPSDIVSRYLECLDRSQFERAADQFSQSVNYHSPLMDSDSVVISGRDNLLEYFRNTRPAQGNEAYHHIAYSVDGAVVCRVRRPDRRPDFPFVSYVEVRNGKVSTHVPSLFQEAYWAEFLVGTDITIE
jgi:ketosteroid isomerase-like protein